MAKNKKPRKKKPALAAKRQVGKFSKKRLDKIINQTVVLHQQGKITEALTLSQKTLIQFPNHPTLLKNAGAFAGMLNDLPLAKKYTRQSLEALPDDAEAHYNLGTLLQRQKRVDEAEQHYQTALKINPDYADAHNNLGLLLQEQKRVDKAEQHYQTALTLNPDYAEAHNNLGNLLQEQKRVDAAEQHYQTALTLNPNYADAHNNLGNLLKEQKHLDAARQHYQSALKLDPNHVDAQWNLSLLLLSLGRFEQGWQGYKFRYHPDREDKKVIPPQISIPHYQGEDLTGKSLLVWPEQGFGDAIQFMRFLPLLKTDKGVKNIVLVCKTPLKKLFLTMPCIDKVIAENAFTPAHVKALDYWLFMLSLPLHFNTVLETLPDTLPYLGSSKQEQQHWQAQLPQADFKVGLVWKGRATHKNDENRSLPSLATLQPLWQLKYNHNIAFISLQKGSGEDEAYNPPVDQPMTHLGGQITDFADSAAIVNQLDLLICVDTAIAHLAGSLGKACWVLLPDYGTDWRWMMDRQDSPWYPDIMRLFRQKTDGDWDEVVKRLVIALSEKIQQRQAIRATSQATS